MHPLTSRRRFLRTVGTTATAITGASVGAHGTATAEYETITVPAGEAQEYYLDDGETFENTLIDQSAEGASYKLLAKTDDWTIRNVGFKGVGEYTGNQFQLHLGGTGRVENLHIDNRVPEGEQGTTNIGGAFVAATHSGRIDVRRTFIAGCGNNGFYASWPGKEHGGEGTVTFENCYHRDNTVAQFRIGTPGSYVRNCLAVVNDPGGRRGGYPFDPWRGNKNARGVWARHMSDQRVQNTAVYVSPDDVNPDGAFEAAYFPGESRGSEAELVVENCDVNPDAPAVADTRNDQSTVKFVGEAPGNDPSVDVLQAGVPLSPEMAARGDQELPESPFDPGEAPAD